MSKPFNLHEEIFFFYLDADAVSAPPCSSEAGSPRTTKGVEDGIAHEREHPHKSLSQFQGVGRRVLPGRCSLKVPDLAEPCLPSASG